MLRKFGILTGVVASLALAAVGCGSDDDDGSSSSGGSGGSGGTSGSAGTGGTSGSAGTGGSGGTSGSAGTGGTSGSAGTGGMAGMGGMAGGSGAMAMVRVVHASPTAPNVDLYLAGDTSTLDTDIEYGESTSYLSVPPGSYQFDLRAAGDPAANMPAFTTPMVSVEADKKYTVIAVGDFTSTDAADQFRVLPFEEGFDAAGTDNVRLRIVHGSYDAPTVGIDVGNDDPSSPEVPALDRFADTGAAGIDLSKDSFQVGITAGGSTVTAFTTPDLTAGAEAFIIATGRLTDRLPRQDDGFALLAVLPDSTTAWIRQNPRVWALHASPDAGPVDIYAGDAELYNNVDYGGLGGAQVPPGMYTLDIFAGDPNNTMKPTGTPVASPMTPMLEAGQSYLAIAAGEVGQSTFQLLAFPEDLALDDTTSGRARLIHASADAPSPVDVGAVAGSGPNAGEIVQVLVSGLAFGSADPNVGGLPVGSTGVIVGVAAAGSVNPAFEFTLSNGLPAGSRSFIVARGDDSGDTSNGFGLFLVDTATDYTNWTVTPIEPD